jgi:hypothetical protein
MCPACDLADLTPLADLGELPVACGLTFPGPVAARLSPKGRMELAACPACGHVANTAFEPKLASFDPSMEAALFHSPTYTAYATGVADRLVKQLGLPGKKVLEVGSGSHVLTEHFNALGCVATGVPAPSVSRGSYDLILARFVLEHVPDPVGLLTNLRKAGKNIFIEVPDAGYDLGTAGWDCIYPHVGYFALRSLQAACQRAGWQISESGVSFNDQYLWAIASAGAPSAPEAGSVPAHDLKFDEATEHWRTALAGRQTVVWGAGTRGTMFCNRVDPRAQLITGVVDRNPGKHGRYLPSTGHRVLSPQELTLIQPSTVIVTNPSYATEIARELASLGVSAEVVVA